MDPKPIVRFPPSPTGPIHIGNIRTALFNFLHAKGRGGKVLFRIEDTDRERSKVEYENLIVSDLAWLGITFDNQGEVWRQSEKSEIYKKHLSELVEKKFAYISKETEVKEGGRESVIRFRNPNKTLTFTDTVRGEISFDTTELGDFVIAKSLDEPIYHLAVVIDDFLMGVNHVIRGEDHISNTPRQILIQEALGAPRPIYTHLPLILAEDRSKLSKRKHGEMVSIDFYRRQGFLPEALLNYLALLGWNPGGEREIFSLDELIKEFDLEKLHHAGAVFDIKKLRWINRQYLQALNTREFLEKARVYLAQTSLASLSEEALEKVTPVIKERIDIFGDLLTLEKEGELAFLAKAPDYPATLLVWKKSDTQTAHKHLSAVKETLEHMPDAGFTSAEDVKGHLWDYAEVSGRGDVLWPLRVALSGKEKSPDPFTLVSVLGKDESIQRITKALQLLTDHT